MNADGPKQKGPKASDRAQEKGCVPCPPTNVL